MFPQLYMSTCTCAFTTVHTHTSFVLWQSDLGKGFVLVLARDALHRRAAVRRVPTALSSHVSSHSQSKPGSEDGVSLPLSLPDICSLQPSYARARPDSSSPGQVDPALRVLPQLPLATKPRAARARPNQSERTELPLTETCQERPHANAPSLKVTHRYIREHHHHQA